MSSNLPPGCGTLPGEEDYPCEICGKEAGDCECPVCPVCSAQGDLRCYTEFGHMQLTDSQKAKMAALQAEYEENCRRENEAMAKYAEEEKAFWDEEERRYNNRTP